MIWHFGYHNHVITSCHKKEFFNLCTHGLKCFFSCIEPSRTLLNVLQSFLCQANQCNLCFHIKASFQILPEVFPPEIGLYLLSALQVGWHTFSLFKYLLQVREKPIYSSQGENLNRNSGRELGSVVYISQFHSFERNNEQISPSSSNYRPDRP